MVGANRVEYRNGTARPYDPQPHHAAPGGVTHESAAVVSGDPTHGGRIVKRMHIGLQVDDLDAAVQFYTRLFGTEPTLRRPDYAKWMLDDPRVNFSLDTHGDGPPGSAHYGIQVDTHQELQDMRTHIDDAGMPRADQDDLVCGYQLQHKSWVTDPTGLRWEAFFTEGLAEAGYGTAEMPEPAEESEVA